MEWPYRGLDFRQGLAAMPCPSKNLGGGSFQSENVRIAMLLRSGVLMVARLSPGAPASPAGASRRSDDPWSRHSPSIPSREHREPEPDVHAAPSLPPPGSNQL